MPLSKSDIAECKEIAREIIKEVLKEHIASCPHGKTLLVSKWFMAGCFIGSGAMGGGVSAVIIKLLTAGG